MFKKIALRGFAVASILGSVTGLFMPTLAAAETATPTPTASTTTSATAGTTAASNLTGDVIVKFTGNAAAQTRAMQRAAARAGITAPGVSRHLATGGSVVSGNGNPVALAKALRAEAGVAYAVPAVKIRATATNDQYFTNQWDLASTSTGVSVEKAWTRTTGSGVRVAVLDTGKTAHPDLAGQFIGGYDFISDRTSAGDGSGRDSDATDPGDYCSSSGSNSSWHGTHVAGTIAALRNNGIGTAGIAPNSKVVPVRVLGRCYGNSADMVDAMIWAAGGHVAGVADNPYPARILNMSLGSLSPMSCDPAMQDAMNQVIALGALPVVAAGNSNTAASSYAPGNCTGAFTVAASNKAGARASYSNYGGPVALAAPGGGDGDASTFIYSSIVNSATTNTGSYGVGLMAGTSMATPHVAAIAALALSLKPSMTVSQLRSWLLGSTKSAPSCSGCGAGILDADLATRDIRTGTVSIVGSSFVGQTLTTKLSGWSSGLTYSYRWMRGSTAISGATASSYKLTTADLNQKIGVKVTASGPGLLTGAPVSSTTSATTTTTVSVNPYVTAGTWTVNGRQWRTTCEAYSQTQRCRAEIWATTVKLVNGQYVSTTGWTFNSLTYLPMTPAQWGSNPLANTGSWTSNGRQWKSECNTAATGYGCRSYIYASVVVATPTSTGGYTYSTQMTWVLNNIVQFA